MQKTSLFREWTVGALCLLLLGACQQQDSVLSTSMDRLSVEEVSEGCFSEQFKFQSADLSEADEVNFLLKEGWGERVDFESVRSHRVKSGKNSLAISIDYCLFDENGDSYFNGDLEEQKSGGDRMVQVCHVPPGNPAAAHTIIVSEQGWLNGHKPGGKHAGKGHDHDYLGACEEADDGSGGDDDGGGASDDPVVNDGGSGTDPGSGSGSVDTGSGTDGSSDGSGSSSGDSGSTPTDSGSTDSNSSDPGADTSNPDDSTVNTDPGAVDGDVPSDGVWDFIFN